MEVSVIGSSQAKVVKTDLAFRVLGFCNSKRNEDVLFRKSRVCFDQTSTRLGRSGIGLTIRAVRAEQDRPEIVSGHSSSSSAPSRTRPNGVRLYVGLPLDAVSSTNTINHAKAIAAGLKALKLLGVEGVELPVWWGIAEKEAMGSYNFSGYLDLVEMVRKAGLKLHVSLCFHASPEKPRIPLPEWVARIGENDPSIYFTDRGDKQYKDCLSLAVDELPVLDGKTPVEVYRDFCESFKASFSQYFKSTITGISMGLGPNGELRYPSDHGQANNTKVPGAGEFQCYDKNMLSLLKLHAEASGNPCWGLGGPHDAPTYDQDPTSSGFFKDHGGSWETPYGDFFLSWYSAELASHGARLLSIGSSVFGDIGVAVHGKIPILHAWNKSRSHPSELTAGFYNTEKRDGYEPIAEVFAKNDCKVILPGMDLVDVDFSTESLLGQVRAAFGKQAIGVSGQNSSANRVLRGGFDRMKENLSENSIGLFIYERMGAYFFSPEHFPSFTAFVRSIGQPQVDFDDLPEEQEVVVGSEESSVNVASESGAAQMQAA